MDNGDNVTPIGCVNLRELFDKWNTKAVPVNEAQKISERFPGAIEELLAGLGPRGSAGTLKPTGPTS